MVLTPEEILALKPGERVVLTGLCFDQTPWTREGTIAAPSVHDGYYEVGGLGTWSAYDTPTPGAVWLPSYRVAIKPKGKRKARGYRTSDVLTVERK